MTTIGIGGRKNGCPFCCTRKGGGTVSGESPFPYGPKVGRSVRVLSVGSFGSALVAVVVVVVVAAVVDFVGIGGSGR